MTNTEVEQVEKVEQERKAVPNLYGTILVLGGLPILCFVSTSETPLWGLNNLPVMRKNRIITPEVFRFDENRSNFVVNWSHILGIPKYVHGDVLNFVHLKSARIFYSVALICFLLGSLLHLYVAVWTLYQPSYAAGRKGKRYKLPILKSTVLLTHTSLFICMVASHFDFTYYLSFVSFVIFSIFVKGYGTTYSVSWIMFSYLLQLVPGQSLEDWRW